MAKGQNETVFVWGTFDRLHEGHKQFLIEAGKLGRLLIAVVPDEVKKQNCGYLPEDDSSIRCKKLREFCESTPGVTLQKIVVACLDSGMGEVIRARPDILCFGYDQRLRFERELVQLLRCVGQVPKVRRLHEYANGIHTSRIRFSTSPETQLSFT